MSRGDRREDIFLDDVDRQDFLKTLAEAWAAAATCARPATTCISIRCVPGCSGRRSVGWPIRGAALGPTWRRRNTVRRRETAEAKAERLIGEELKRLGWTEGELAARRKSDPLKLALAARLRKETTLSLKAIAGRVHFGAAKGANTTCTDGCVPRRRKVRHRTSDYERACAFLWADPFHGYL